MLGIRTTSISVLLALAILSGIPLGSAALLKAYDLVGEDKKGDAHNNIAPGAAADAAITPDRVDIVALEMANDGDNLQFKLDLVATPAGTGGYMYAIHVKSGATTYVICYAVQWTGGQSAANQENTLGCSRFVGETAAGPVSSGATLQVGSDGGKNFIRWEVPKSALGVKAGVDSLPSIVADTWFRGASTCCAGSTQHTQYMWNQADRAPDTGVWGYSLAPPAPALALTLTAASNTTKTGPGGSAAYNLTAALSGNGTANVTFNATGLPSGYTASFSPSNASLSAAANSTPIAVSVSIPANATNDTHTFQVTVMATGNISASVNLTLVVDASIRPAARSSTPAGGNSTVSATAVDSGSAKDTKKASVPGLEAWAAVGAVSSVILLRRRRSA